MHATGASGGLAGKTGAAHVRPVEVMMLGDSITASTCYPELVSKGLIASGHENFRFVGSQSSQQWCNATSVKEEGHGGYGVTYLPMNGTRRPCRKAACGSYAELRQWAAEKPDIVLMHFGTNDVWDGQPVADVLSAYSAVIAEFRARNPSVVFFVSKIIKLSPSGCASCLADVAALAAALTEAWATNNSAPASPVFIVDDYDSGFDPTSKSDTHDGVHPTLAGAQKVANATVAAVIARNYF
jgi:lysophospholipase L1-like esterase